LREPHEGRPKLLFLNGFGVAPVHYKPYLKLLARHYDVVAPSMCAINIYDPSPTTLEEYVQIVMDFCDGIHLKPDAIVGHSLGGAVSFSLSMDLPSKAVVGINPLMPVSFGFWHFFRRTVGIGVRSAWHEGLNSFLPKVIAPYLANLMRGITDVPNLVQTISAYNFNRADGADLDVRVPALIIQSDNDELFELTEDARKRIDKVFRDGTIVHVRYHHDYPLAHPEHCAKRTLEFLKEAGFETRPLRRKRARRATAAAQ
jgi:pimeloyl-ACP methyl ester carboxylesterase